MPTRRRSQQRRTSLQVSADRRAAGLAATLGRAIGEARREHGLRQFDVAARAAIAQSTQSEMECGHGADVSLLVWVRAAYACGTDLRAYLERTSASAQPRDAVHLRHQELVARLASAGSWRPMPEAQLDIDPTRSRSADLLLMRPDDVALFEIWDSFEDVGAAFRSWDRRLGRLREREAGRPRSNEARMLPADVRPNGAGVRPIEPRERPDGSKLHPDEPGQVHVAGCWVVRATRRNRQLVREHATLFAARFPGSGHRWLAALAHPEVSMPRRAGLLWATVAGDRLFPARLPDPSQRPGQCRL